MSLRPGFSESIFPGKLGAAWPWRRRYDFNFDAMHLVSLLCFRAIDAFRWFSMLSKMRQPLSESSTFQRTWAGANWYHQPVFTMDNWIMAFVDTRHCCDFWRNLFKTWTYPPASSRFILVWVLYVLYLYVFMYLISLLVDHGTFWMALSQASTLQFRRGKTEFPNWICRVNCFARLRVPCCGRCIQTWQWEAACLCPFYLFGFLCLVCLKHLVIICLILIVLICIDSL